MSLWRIRLGESMALVGAGCVIASFLLPWYENTSGKLSAWQTFGPAVVLLIISCAVALLLVIATLTERSSALPIAAAIWSTLFGLIAAIAALVRVLERPAHSNMLCAGAWVALIGALVILIGGWQSMRDERTSMYEPPEIEPRKPPL
jgi:hypothetical protein